MRAFTSALLAAGLLAAFGVSTAASAQTQLFQPENVSAWVDVRAVTADGEQGWRDGGFGKLRYGNETKFDVGQAAINWKPRLSDTLTGYVLAQYTPGGLTEWGLSEAYIKWKPVPRSDLRYSARLGQMFPPVSMEHDGPGWSVSRTLTPSAINSWIGEEVLVDGLEGTIQKTFGGHTLGLTAAVFTGNDTAGTILSWRGWALHDVASDRDTRLKLPSGDTQGYYLIFGDDYQDPYTEPMAETDGHSGQYLRLDWRPPAPFAVNFEVYANNADPESVRHAQWGWDTHFSNLGLQAQVSAKDQILAQYMAGRTVMGWRISADAWAIDDKFDSAYILLTHSFDNGAKLTGRADYFAVKDHSWRSIDDNTEKGYSATVAYIRPMTAHLDLAIEALQVASNRPARTTQSIDPHQSQTQIQVAFKLHL